MGSSWSARQEQFGQPESQQSPVSVVSAAAVQRFLLSEEQDIYARRDALTKTAPPHRTPANDRREYDAEVQRLSGRSEQHRRVAEGLRELFRNGSTTE